MALYTETELVGFFENCQKAMLIPYFWGPTKGTHFGF